jgi:hypothetical protein
MVHDATDHAVLLHLPELPNEHLLRHVRTCTLEIRETQDAPAEEMEQDHELPPSFEQPQGLFSRVTGDFPGSPVDLRNVFVLQDGAIARLEIDT